MVLVFIDEAVYKKLFTLPVPCGHTAATFLGPTPLPVSLCL